jgi:hypothetical protein
MYNLRELTLLNDEGPPFPALAAGSLSRVFSLTLDPSGPWRAGALRSLAPLFGNLGRVTFCLSAGGNTAADQDIADIIAAQPTQLRAIVTCIGYRPGALATISGACGPLVCLELTPCRGREAEMIREIDPDCEHVVAIHSAELGADAMAALGALRDKEIELYSTRINPMDLRHLRTAAVLNLSNVIGVDEIGAADASSIGASLANLEYLDIHGCDWLPSDALTALIRAVCAAQRPRRLLEVTVSSQRGTTPAWAEALKRETGVSIQVE